MKHAVRKKKVLMNHENDEMVGLLPELASAQILQFLSNKQGKVIVFVYKLCLTFANDLIRRKQYYLCSVPLYMLQHLVMERHMK